MISIKGLRQGLLIVFSAENEPWLSKLRELESKLNANSAFFQGGQVAFDVGPLALTRDDLQRSIDLLAGHDVKLFAVLGTHDGTQANITALGLLDALPTAAPRARAPKPAQKPVIVSAAVDAVTPDAAASATPELIPSDTNGAATETPVNAQVDASTTVTPDSDKPLEATPETPAAAPDAQPPAPTAAPAIVVDEEPEQGTDGALIKKRIRSGQMVRHPGHVVIVGDVNPGAQVIAGGDIIVWGKLQGTAHAGAYGNLDAVICALDLSPALLKIADLTIRSHKGKAEMARVKNQEITFAKWDTKP